MNKQDVFDAAVRAAIIRRLTRAGIPIDGKTYPVGLVDMGDTIKLVIDGRVYDLTITKGLIP